MHLPYAYTSLRCRLMNEGVIKGRGGNYSVKYGSEIYISPSGIPIQEADSCRCQLTTLSIKNEDEYFAKGKQIVAKGNTRLPSMEYGFHYLLPYPYVVHLHLAKLNAILCSKEAPHIIAELFSNVCHYFITYVTPGFELFKKMKTLGATSDTIFLQNHGLIVSSYSEDGIFSKLKSIESVVDGFLNRPLYPDAACLPAENVETNREILSGIRNLGLTPRFLTETEIETLKGLEYEKHRAKPEKGVSTI